MAKRSPSVKSPSLHDQIIADVQRDWPEAKTSGFMRSLAALPDAEYMQDMCENDPDWVSWVRFVPDVYLIDPVARHVVIFEAVVTNDVSPVKFAQMADLSWALDEDYYQLILVRCDRFGRTVFSPQMASIFNAGDRVSEGKDASLEVFDDWQKYTMQHCARRLAA